MTGDLFQPTSPERYQSPAEVAARKCGWRLHSLDSLSVLCKHAGGEQMAKDLAGRFVFYHRDSDTLDAESTTWQELAERQPRIMAIIEKEKIMALIGQDAVTKRAYAQNKELLAEAAAFAETAVTNGLPDHPPLTESQIVRLKAQVERDYLVAMLNRRTEGK